MDTIIQKITEWLKTLLIKGITDQLTGMIDTVNLKVGEIAAQVGTTPSAWNGGVFSMIRSLSETVIVPIAGVVLTFIMCYELIHMVIDKNNLHDVDTWMFFRWIFKTFVAVMIVTNTFNIVMGIFDVAQSVVNRAAGVISTRTNIDISAVIGGLTAKLEAMELGQLIGLYFQSMIVSLSMSILSVCIFVVIYGRMVEIYLTVSLGPIPLATMANHEWGSIGQNYLKSLFALGFQAFLIMVCVGIYAVLVQSIAIDADIMKAVWTCMGYTVLLCFTLFKTGSLSKSVFSAR
ncbi:MAG TPA: CD0415/CD1112 family protein [Clostridia bacterium]|nr:CD0415/CD1112 family protein [Clostridia bacterium]